jgi:hypothetical protein
MDFFEPLPATNNGNCYVLSFTDAFSKWVELISVKRVSEEEVAEALINHIIYKHEAINTLISDHNQSFVSEVMNEVYKLFKIQKVQTSAWHP